jgi:biotin carboxylase
MKKIAIIGANEFQNRLILKAKEMGYETHAFAWKDGAVGEKEADYFYPISIVEKDRILEICKSIHPNAVASIASDLAAPTVNYVSGKLGLVCNDVQSVLSSTNKYEMRKALKNAGIYTPGFVLADETWQREGSSLQFPLIVKPTDRSGSRGVTKVQNADELPECISNAIANSFEKKAIVEEFIDGDEYSCESISWEGKHHFLTLTKKFTTNEPHFIETGHLQPSGLDAETQSRVIAVVFSALDALGIRYGASHAEFRVNHEGRIGIIEVGARMAGDCIGSDLVQISTGYDYMRMVIDVALGNPPVFTRASVPKVAVVRFIFSHADLDVLQRIRQDAPEVIFRVSDMAPIGSHSVVDSSTRFGYYILSCTSVAEAYRMAGL